MQCIIHYDGQAPYSKLKHLSDANILKIKESKRIRQQLGGSHYHSQVDSVPENIDKLRHGVHLTPCYKTFTLITGSKKYKAKLEAPTVEEENTKRVTRSRPLPSPISFQSPSSSPLNSPISSPASFIGSPLQSPSSATYLYGPECQFCKKINVQHNGKKVKPTMIATFSAQDSIRKAAEKTDANFHFMIQEQDLIAKEFKYHRHCFRNFVRVNSVKEKNVESSEENKNYGDYVAVRKCVDDNVVSSGQVVSMRYLYGLYKIGEYDSRYASKLKEKLQTDYGESLAFIPRQKRNETELVIGTASIDKFIVCTEENAIENAAKIIAKDIKIKDEQRPDMDWPPSSDELLKEEFRPPDSAYFFVVSLFKHFNNRASLTNIQQRMIESIASDLVFGSTSGKSIQLKHFLLGIGLHDLTGSRKVIDIVHGLGHCLAYNLTMDVKTGVAEQVVEKMAAADRALPLQPLHEDSVIPTFFWVDNFDLKIDKVLGGGAINNTHMMAFQEPTQNAIHIKNREPVARRKSRKIFIDDLNVPFLKIDNNVEPPKILGSSVEINFKSTVFDKFYFLWTYIRNRYFNAQFVPSFKGYLLQIRNCVNNTPPLKTFETFLPPLNAKVTDFQTIQTYITYLQRMANSVNMPFVNITLDVGAAINAFKTVWNHPDVFKNVVIHLGGFHFLKENFQVLGTIVNGSGFEEVVYQSKVCTSGSLRGVLNGTHYNRAWSVHRVMSEALERIFVRRFLNEIKPKIPEELDAYQQDPRPELVTEELLASMDSLFEQYAKYRESAKEGTLGYTARFWIMYMDLMRIQILAQSAIQENNFHMVLYAWKEFLSLYFALNKVHYARYGSYYVHLMENIEVIHPGLKEFLDNAGLTVQGQDEYHLRTATDQRGEQTFNKDAKTIGGIQWFASDQNNVLKWCLNRPHQAKVAEELAILTSNEKRSTIHKSLRPSEIAKEEKLITKVMEVLETEYLNPFSETLVDERLMNISSGESVGIATLDILELPKTGREMADNFLKERLLSETKKFHDLIPKNKIPSFSPEYQVSKGNQIKVVEANRNVIGKLLALSTKYERPIDLESAMAYPMYPVPLSLAHPDGAKRSTQKSKLLDIFHGERKEVEYVPDANFTFIVDLIAQIRVSMKGVSGSYEDLFDKIFNSIPKRCKRVDIVADTYRNVSIKSSERTKRGGSAKLIIGSSKSKLPSDIGKFLKNNDNKTALINLMVQYTSSNRHTLLNRLGTEKIYFSTDGETRVFTNDSEYQVAELSSNQEEADTKVILHTIDALNGNISGKVILRSPSGDTDIVVLAVALIPRSQQERVIYDSGSGNNRTKTELNEFELDENHIQALIGFHAFTGNDYISAMFRKGKLLCWKLIIKHQEFVDTFGQIGQNWNVDKDLIDSIEGFVCRLYGYGKSKSVNIARVELFRKKHIDQMKVIDLSLLPPCLSSLELHIKRANYVAAIWKRTLIPMIQIPSFSEHGWNQQGEILWCGSEPFPEDIEDLLFDYNSDSEEEVGNEEESDDEELDL